MSLFGTPEEKERRIIRDFCDAIFEACPWAAPQSWHAHKARVEKLKEQLFGAAGFNREDLEP